MHLRNTSERDSRQVPPSLEFELLDINFEGGVIANIRVVQKPAMSLAEAYLRSRGLSLELAARFGIEIQTPPDPTVFKDRLGMEYPEGVESILWIPILSKAGATISWIARLLHPPLKWPKFLCAKDSGALPWLVPELYDHKADRALIVTEGPIRTIKLELCGYDAVGLNGVWCAAAARHNGDEPLCLRPELEDLHLLGRKVYLAFDADQDTNPGVRQALIRLFLLLTKHGALVYQLTTWPSDTAKGIDDYLMTQESEGAQTIAALITAAKPFIETLQPALDVHFVQSELPQIEFGPIVRDQLTKQLARALDVRVDVLRAVAEGPLKPKPELSFAANYEPWPEKVDAEELFNEVMVQIRKEAIIEQHQLWLSALEVFMTWVHDQMDFSPILYITGPTRECGKTRLLGAIGKMARRPLKTSSITAPSLFRLSELYKPTVLVDEAQDAVKNEDFCTVLKAGHDPSDVAVRCAPNTNEPETFDVFCPKVLAGIGRANGQIMSRSVTIEMERSPSEVDSGRKLTDPVFVDIRRKLARWAQDVSNLRRFRLPKETAKMRQKDNWEVYYRVACGISQYVADELLNFIPVFVDEEQDFDTYLLGSLRELYREHGLTVEGGHLGSEMILEVLNADKEAPWFAERRGRESKGLTTERLSSRLRRYKVKPQRHWYPDIEKKVRGYFYIDPQTPQNSLKRVFDQYLPAEKAAKK